MRVEQRIGERLPHDAARACVLAASLRPPVLAAQGAIAVGFTLLAGSLGGWLAGSVTAVLLVVVFVLQRPVAISSLARALPARGYRPGTTLALEWSEDSFALTTARGTTTYRHDEVGWSRRCGRFEVLFVTEAKVLVLLPTAMVAAVTGTAAQASAG